MKRLYILLFIGALLIVPLGGLNPVSAATTDSFQITITVGYISIGLYAWNNTNYTTWAIGAVSASSVSTMSATYGTGAGEEGILVSNESNTNIDLSSYATNTNGWSLVSGSPSANEYKLRGKSFTNWEATGEADMSSGAVTITSTGSPGQDIVTTVEASGNRYFYYELTAPASVTSGSGNTITVTIEASGS